MISEVKKMPISYLDECLSVFQGDDFNDRYNGQVLDWVKTGIRKNELWGAISDSGEVAAVMWIEETGFFHEYPYLALIGVKKNYQDQGLGSFLLTVYEAIGRTLNKNKITLMVGDFNTRAKKLYESMGYSAIGKVESAYMPSIGEFIMIKKLD